jgi:branched-chain amino acid transport system substrate-binding protein
MLKKSFLVLLSVAVSILMAAGSVSAQTCDAKDELLIGDHQPLSGAAAAAGQAIHNAVKLALKHYNEGTHPLNPTPCLHVGGKKYKLTDAVYDNRYTAEGGIAAAKRLVFEDGAKFVVGTMGSGPSVAASDAVFEANKIIFVTTGWSKNVISKDKPFTWRLNPTASEFGEAFWQWAKENLPNVKTVGMTARNDEAGRGTIPGVHATMKKFGIEPIITEYYEVGTQDFYPHLTRIIAAKPDMILAGGKPVEEGLMAKQLHELGWEGPVSQLCQQPEVHLETTGSKEALEGVYCFYGVDFEAGPPFITPEMERIYKAYNAEYPGVIMDPISLMVYDATVGVLEAIKMAQTLDTEKVNYVFGNFNWLLSTGVMSSWGGKEKIGRDAQIVQPVSVSQWKDGKIQIIGMPIVPVP